MVQVGNDKSLNFRVAGFREDPLYPGILGVGTPSPTKVCLTVDRYHLPTLLSVPPTDFFSGTPGCWSSLLPEMSVIVNHCCRYPTDTFSGTRRCRHPLPYQRCRWGVPTVLVGVPTKDSLSDTILCRQHPTDTIGTPTDISGKGVQTLRVPEKVSVGSTDTKDSLQLQ